MSKAFGAASSISYGNNRNATLSYDNTLMRLTSLEVARPNESDRVLAYNYAYLENGLLGQVQDVLDATYLRAFEYNSRHQLTKTTGNWSQTVNTYSYDDWGHLTNRDGSSLSYATGPGSVPTTNRVTSTTYGGTTNFTYDNAGNMTAANSTTYQWDAANRLKSVNNGSLGSYGYDGNGKRVKKSESGVTTYYVISSVLGSVMEVTSAGVQRAYVLSGGLVVAQLNPNGQFYWLHLDHLGSGRKMTDTSGNMVYRAEFDPYGKLLYEWSSPTNLNTKKFTGYERDATTNLDYAQARMYGSEWGRFMSPDPIGLKSANQNSPQSLNRYSYTRNNPINATDPSGLLTLLIHGTGNDPNEHEWARQGSDFWQAVFGTFNDYQLAFDWREFSGVDQVSIATLYSGIFAGGAKLVNFLNNVYTFKEGEKLNIIAHSHGGNIVNYASQYLTHQIDNLSTLGTPQNTDLAVINGRVGAKNHCNVSSLADPKQFIGASPTQVGLTITFTVQGFSHAFASVNYWWMAISALSNPWPSGIFDAAYYFDLSVHHAQLSTLYFGLATVAMMSTRINLFADRNVLLGSESHHDLITPGTWNNRVKSNCGL